ncbi:unnamed protein product [Urochloa decumbens]|uniref:Major facilitator superfamily (MFS) profile domain-containing protein n=1 Tax=Urochloa decumbens TaxID=240449 RepID=A0ABC9B7N9_9POAL
MAGEGEAARPLLEEKPDVYFDGCPGCAMDRRKAENPGIPYGLFFHMWIINLVTCLPVSSLFPFLYFMIRDLGIAKRVEDIGFYAGFVGASYMLGRALTSIFWGILADRIGRKPIIVITTFSRFPYVLLCLFISIICFIVLISYIWLPETLHTHKVHKKKDDQCRESLITYLSDSKEFDKQCSTSTKNKGLLTNWPLMSSIVLYCITCFDDMAYSEIFSLWAESDKKYGGLSFSSEDVGNVLVVTGASILLYQTFIYPHIVKVLGLINSSRVATILSMVLLFTYPPMANLSRPWLSIVVNIASMLKSCSIATIVTCSFILQNNSVPQDQRATANGIATMLMSLFKAFAPAGAGIVFSWAQKHQHASIFPGDQMVFFLLDIVVLFELIWTFKPFLDIPKQSSSS